MTILIPQYRTSRRASAVDPVALIESLGSATTDSMVFSGTPSDGELIVICACTLNGGGATSFTWPAGFTEQIYTAVSSLRPLAIATKVAASEASATYAVTNTVGSTRLLGYRLSGHGASPIGNVDEFANDSANADVPAGATGISVSAGSLVIAAWNGGGGYTYTPDNSFGGTVTGGSGRIGSSYRIYSAADTGQNCTATRSASTGNRRGALIEIKT